MFSLLSYNDQLGIKITVNHAKSHTAKLYKLRVQCGKSTLAESLSVR